MVQLMKTKWRNGEDQIIVLLLRSIDKWKVRSRVKTVFHERQNKIPRNQSDNRMSNELNELEISFFILHPSEYEQSLHFSGCLCWNQWYIQFQLFGVILSSSCVPFRSFRFLLFLIKDFLPPTAAVDPHKSNYSLVCSFSSFSSSSSFIFLCSSTNHRPFSGIAVRLEIPEIFADSIPFNSIS